ncbi:MAG TPA: 4-hydroxy-3-methylbut-2-enyl diphosphate reductase [Candidatus Onthomorpha intestinigallinarum]|uniref:4-hydroxy-3-methylbut-2-enyl diphosphate reductase n=1 Tax=Candidatus Onthomorpha intestinigallinarum TaxID=2840880 RepID=A0A9D1RHW8_9BACT|nr:4-hydroxy-3-methylbut-2-enyl diphosphate reductase [Candidatus Onthomorpha intestinigallinarum]
MEVVIDREAGFCFGVVSAIEACERQLRQDGSLYCIGDIVHNSKEVERLKALGLRIIDKDELNMLGGCKVMIRAHGEPPSTYELAEKRGVEIIDATCPIVLKLQRDVRQGYERMKRVGGQVVIFGKQGHAEVVGLMGQTEDKAIVVSSEEDLEMIDFNRPVHLFSQTTKNKEDFVRIVGLIRERMKAADNEAGLFVTDSICRRVSSRSRTLLEFADKVCALLFVSGRQSSNGTYLYSLCRQHKKETYFISSKEDIDFSLLKDCDIVGISGATSTPMWLMEEIRDYVLATFEAD